MSARSGLHTGECEVRPGGLAGAAVEAARRLAAAADGGEIVVSGTVRDLVAGSGLEFLPRPAATAGDSGDGLPLFAVAAFAARSPAVVRGASHRRASSPAGSRGH
jgi:class 3 adenylate cyclase